MIKVTVTPPMKLLRPIADLAEAVQYRPTERICVGR